MTDIQILGFIPGSPYQTGKIPTILSKKNANSGLLPDLS